MSQEPFVHQSLADARKQIRLLRFSDNGKEDGTIALEIYHADISSPPSYAAISYTWGSIQDFRRITIDGRSFEVWPNCHYALTQVRPQLRAGVGHFWLDSICINQRDLDEKALQVEMMADIYTRAEMVFSCVGPHADDSEIVLPFVKEMATWVRSQPLEHRYNQNVATGHVRDLHSRGEDYDLEFGRRSTAAYVAFGNREYWQRMWIVQEARLAKKCSIFCGADSIDLADFATFLRAMMDDKAADADFWIATWLLTDMWRVVAGSLHLPKRAEADGNVRPLPVSKALERFDWHKASNFRDHLYALARVTEWPDGRPPPTPDYRVSKLVLLQEVLQRLTKVGWAEHRCCKAISRLTAAFDLTIHEPEMQALIEQRGQAAQGHINERKRGPTSPFLYAGEYQRRPGGCRIRLASDGTLTSNIGNSKKGSNFVNEKARIWTSKIGKPLYVDGAVAGYLCPQAQPDDVLLEIDTGYGLPIWLVIRVSDKREQETNFSIIGPALANPGFAVQSTERTGYLDLYDFSKIPEDQRNMPSVFDLWFDQEDFLVWRAWVHTFEKGMPSKEEVDGFLEGKDVNMTRSLAVLVEKGVDWTMA